MPIPTVSEIMTDSAALLGDPAQERFTPAVQAPFFGMAYREMFDIMIRWRLPIVEREAYVVLRDFNIEGLVMTMAHSRVTALIPSSSWVAIFDIGEPSRLWERQISASEVFPITGHVSSSLTRSSVSGLASNDDVTASGFTYPPEANGRWFIEVIYIPSIEFITLRGAPGFGAGTFVGPFASLVRSTAKFQEMIPVGALPQLPPSDTLRWWKWENDTFYFNGATTLRELKIEYTASGTAPASGPVLVDNSRNFLAARTASLAALMNDMPTRGEQLTRLALGPSGEADGTGGYLRDLVNPMLKEKQKRPKSPQPFRPNRNVLTRQLW